MAFHEAGHAVVAVAVGSGQPRRVSILGDAESSGHVRFTNFVQPPELVRKILKEHPEHAEKMRRHDEREAMVALAGYTSELALVPGAKCSRQERYLSPDYQEVLVRMSAYYEEPWVHTWWLQRLERRTRRLVELPLVRESIELVVKELLRHKVLEDEGLFRLGGHDGPLGKRLMPVYEWLWGWCQKGGRYRTPRALTAAVASPGRRAR